MSAEHLSAGLKALGAGMGTAINVTMDQAKMLHDDNLARFRADQDLILAGRADAREKEAQDRADKRSDKELASREADRAAARDQAKELRAIDADRYFRGDLADMIAQRAKLISEIDTDLSKDPRYMMGGPERDAEYTRRTNQVNGIFRASAASVATSPEQEIRALMATGEVLTPQRQQIVRDQWEARQGKAAPAKSGSAGPQEAAPTPANNGSKINRPSSPPPVNDEAGDTGAQDIVPPATTAQNPAAAQQQAAEPVAAASSGEGEADSSMLDLIIKPENQPRVRRGFNKVVGAVSQGMENFAESGKAEDRVRANIAAKKVVEGLRQGKDLDPEQVQIAIDLGVDKLKEAGWKPDDFALLQKHLESVKNAQTSPAPEAGMKA